MSALLLLVLLAAAAPAGDPPRADFVLRATRAHLPEGVVEDAWLVVRTGRIEAVGSGAGAPEDLPAVHVEGELSAGLIALHDASGAEGENLDTTRATLPEGRVVYGLREHHSAFRRLVREGITTIELVPPRDALVGGLCAVLKTSGGRVLNDRAHLALSLTSRALPHDRWPTSYSGALALLADELEEAEEGPLAEARDGTLPVLIEVEGKHEILRALDFAAGQGLVGALSGASRAGELAEAIAASGLAIVYRPFDPGMETRSLASVPPLAEAGVPFGFGLDAPDRDPASLRVAAAACVREGLAPDRALRALTVDAAAIAGVEEAVGSLAPGRDADLVLWSGPPIELASRVLAVWVDGRLVHDARAPEGAAEGASR